MNPIPFTDLLQYGIAGLLVITLLIGWYERKQMRDMQFELIKLLMVAHPEAASVVKEPLRSQVQKHIPNVKKFKPMD